MHPGCRHGPAWTPLLDEPLQGPVYLRSSNHKLPDLVFDLHGLVDVEVAVRIGSERGGIRASLESVPTHRSPRSFEDAGSQEGPDHKQPQSLRAQVEGQCAFTGHNGKQASANPVMRAECGKRKRSR